MPLLFTATLLTNFAHAEQPEPREATLYRVALNVILEHEKPRNFALWNQLIDSSTMESVRVPRQNPDHQFIRALKDVPASLEKSLLASASVSAHEKMLPRFDIPAVAANFSGIVDNAALRQAERVANPNDVNSWLMVTGFSKIGFSDDGHSALFYAEACLTGPGGTCGGEGFWFVQGKSGWQLKRHAYLWQGESEPFWRLRKE